MTSSSKLANRTNSKKRKQKEPSGHPRAKNEAYNVLAGDTHTETEKKRERERERERERT